MLSGRIVGQGVAATATGDIRVPYLLIQPEKSPLNLKEIAREGQRWRTTVERYKALSGEGRLDPNVTRRAQFVEEVLAGAGENLRQGICCLLVAQGKDGRILGVVVYMFTDQAVTLNLQGIDPEHLPGAPNGQLRGIGTALVGAASRDFVSRGVQTVYLHPLDEQAAIFWRNRGFGVCGAGGLMCVRGRGAIEGLMGNCRVQPDCPDGGECLVCGLPRDTEAMRVPSAR